MEKIVIYFGKNQKSPLPREIDKLKPLEEVIGISTTKVKIHGHASKEGRDSYNMDLGFERASFLSDYLIVMGGSPSQMEIKSFGERQPAVPERGRGSVLEAHRAKNRRVEISYTAGSIYQKYLDTLHSRFSNTVKHLENILHKARQARERTLRHPNKNPVVLQSQQEFIDEIESERDDYKRYLKDLELLKTLTKDPKKRWLIASKTPDYYNNIIRMSLDRIERTKKRIADAEQNLRKSRTPKERAFWNELLTNYRYALERYNENLRWARIDRIRSSQKL